MKGEMGEKQRAFISHIQIKKSWGQWEGGEAQTPSWFLAVSHPLRLHHKSREDLIPWS